MINNRQGGRRRGRGGQRPPNMGGRPEGNRQDNRQRGNAAQLLEKYKSMARDAQLGGDRVQSEYYLQFADHYFRVLGESRARFEDQRRQRGDDSDDDEGDDYLEAADDGDNEARDDEQRFERPDRNPERAPDRSAERGNRGDRPDRPDRGDRRPRRFVREERNGEEAPERVNGSAGNGAYAESIAVDVLPPAIGRDEAGDGGSDSEATARPRRRARRPAADDGDKAPAA